MARIHFDPENEVRHKWQPIGRIDMRSPQLRLKHAEVLQERARLEIERTAGEREARIAMLAEEARKAREAILAQKAAAKSAAEAAGWVVTTTPIVFTGTKFQRIVRRAVKVFGVSVSLIKSQRRSRQIVLARQFIMYWAVRTTSLSLPQIGKLMGGRDHTTVLHGKKAYVVKRASMSRTLRKAR